MDNWLNTIAGRDFSMRTIPELTKALNRLSDALENSDVNKSVQDSAPKPAGWVKELICKECEKCVELDSMGAAHRCEYHTKVLPDCYESYDDWIDCACCTGSGGHNGHCDECIEGPGRLTTKKDKAYWAALGKPRGLMMELNQWVEWKRTWLYCPVCSMSWFEEAGEEPTCLCIEERRSD